MRQKISFHSLRSRMVLLSGALFVAIAALLVYHNLVAANLLREEICNAAQQLLSASANRLNDSFSSASTYIASFVFEKSNIESLERSTLDTTDFHIAVARIKRQFANSLPGYGVDSFFYYDPTRHLFFANTADLNNPVREALMREKNLPIAKWYAIPIDEDYYLLRITKVSRSYIGAWIRVSSALSQVQSGTFADSAVYLLDDSSTFLSKTSPLDVLPTALSEPGYSFISEGKERFLAVTQKASFGRFSLITLIPDATVSSNMSRFNLVIILASLFAFSIIAFATAMLQRWFVGPVKDLTAGIRALQSGDFHVSLPANTYGEFLEVNQAFNAATEEIATLKIDMYEERLRKQNIQMQYLQLQISPHFLINCLNTIYQLTDTNQPELTRTMLCTLSEHLRYTLSSSQTVTLEEELRHVENYIALSVVRYPGSVALYTDCQPQALKATVIPLLLLNFVENTIKYEAAMGKLLQIHISIRKVRQAEKSTIHLCIWDTGGGFNPELLSDLQDIPSYIEKYKEQHIGIGNVFQRARIVFGDCDFQFRNRSGAGAQIDIAIPYLPFLKAGDRDESADRG